MNTTPLFDKMKHQLKLYRRGDLNIQLLALTVALTDSQRLLVITRNLDGYDRKWGVDSAACQTHMCERARVQCRRWPLQHRLEMSNTARDSKWLQTEGGRGEDGVEGMTETYATLMRGNRLPEMRTDGEEKRWRTGNPTPTGQRATIKIIKCNLTSSAFNCINSRQSVHGSVPRPVKPASNSTFVLKSYLSQSKCE